MPRQLARSRGLGRPRMGGRSLPPARARPVAVRLAGAKLAAQARARGKSAPPDTGPPLKILESKGRPLQTNARFPAAVLPSSVLPVNNSRLTESNLKAVASMQKASSLRPPASAPALISEPTAPPQVAAGENADVEGSEWYSRLMSRLQRLSHKPSAAEEAPRIHLLGEASLTSAPEQDRGVRPRGTAPTFGRTSSRDQLRQQLQLNVNEEAPVVLTREAPAVTPPLDQRVSAPLDGEHASMLLSELPGRDERRDIHVFDLSLTR